MLYYAPTMRQTTFGVSGELDFRLSPSGFPSGTQVGAGWNLKGLDYALLCADYAVEHFWKSLQASCSLRFFSFFSSSVFSSFLSSPSSFCTLVEEKIPGECLFCLSRVAFFLSFFLS